MALYVGVGCVPGVARARKEKVDRERRDRRGAESFWERQRDRPREEVRYYTPVSLRLQRAATHG